MSDVDQAPTIAQRLTAEALGTFLLVFFGCGSFVFADAAVGRGAVGILAIAVAFGLALTVGILAFARISGAHFNPAVSVGASLAGRQSWKDTGLYAATQVGAAVVAGLVLFILLQGYDGFEAEGAMGQNAFGDEALTKYAVWSAFLLELLLTLIFVLVILVVTDTRQPHPAAAPAAIGIALVVIHLVGIPATGTSVNPARSIGPALFAGGDAILQLWLFILAPLLGAAAAGLLYPLLFGRDADPVEGSGLNFSRPAKPAAAGGWDANAQWGQPAQTQQFAVHDPADAQQGQQAQAQAQQQAQQQAWGQPGQQAQQPVQTEYPGWKWDAAAQQWVPDPQWQQQAPQATEGEDYRTQIRPNDP